VSASSEATVVLSLTERAVEVRRSLEPTAWLVLEELALTVPGAQERPVGVRSIAAALGRSPDAVARALQPPPPPKQLQQTDRRSSIERLF
jgi:hypothetical protein